MRLEDDINKAGKLSISHQIKNVFVILDFSESYALLMLGIGICKFIQILLLFILFTDTKIYEGYILSYFVLFIALLTDFYFRVIGCQFWIIF